MLFALFLVCVRARRSACVPVQGGLPAGYGAAPRLGAASLSVALCAGFYGLWRFEFAILGPLPDLVRRRAADRRRDSPRVDRDRLRDHPGRPAALPRLLDRRACRDRAARASASRCSATPRTSPTLAAAGLLAATLQVCAHNLAKTLALIGVDRVEQATGERTLDPLGGLAPRAAGERAALGVASLTLAAIPPLGGFVSEWFTFEALLQGFRMPTLLSQLLCALAAAALALTAGLGLLAFAKYYSFIFLGRRAQRACARRARAVALAAQPAGARAS